MGFFRNPFRNPFRRRAAPPLAPDLPANPLPILTNGEGETIDDAMQPALAAPPHPIMADGEPEAGWSSVGEAEPPAPDLPGGSVPGEPQPATPPPSRPTATGGEDEPEDDQLLAALTAFVNAPLAEKRALLHRTPALLTPDAVTLLRAMAQAAQAERPDTAQVIEAHAQLLELAQRDGIDLALDAVERAETDDDMNAIAQALNDLLSTQTWGETRRVLEARRDLLLTDAAIRMLLAAAQRAEQAGDTRRRDYDMLHVRLLANARDQGIDAAWATFMQEAKPFSSEAPVDPDDDAGDVFRQWLNTPNYREERRFLERHPELLSDASEAALTQIITAITEDKSGDPQKRQQRIEQLNGRRNALRDIRERIDRLRASGRFPDEQSLIVQAVREGYVNWRGGFMLDIPAWLEETIRQDGQLHQSGQPLERALRRVVLWQDALRRAQAEGLAEEIVAEIFARLKSAFHDAQGQDKPDFLESELACAQAALETYTEDRYPYQWAMTQNNLGNVYSERIRGDKAENQEQAIACYSAALRVRTEQTVPFDWAMTQNNLGAVYQERIRGDKAENQEQALACYSAALRVYTEQSVPYQWATTQNNLGNVYQTRIRGDKAENQEQAIACYSAALRVRTEDVVPLNHRSTALNKAETLAALRRWSEVHNTYQSALRTENTLYALAGGAKAQDAILAAGRDGPARDAFALARLGRLEDAAVTLERGLARGLAAARALDAADPTRIHDPARRADYINRREAWRQALAAVQQPEERLPLPDEVPPELRDEVIRRRVAQEVRQRDLAQQLSQARDAFDATVAAIHAAGDPADFLRDDIAAADLLAAARGKPAGHAVVALVATPQGGMALGVLAAQPDLGTQDRFAALDLPDLTGDALFTLISHTLDGADGKIMGGFGYAQEGSAFDFLLRDWADRERPAWNPAQAEDLPLREWEQRDASRRRQARDNATFAGMAAWLRETCRQRDVPGTLDRACQDVLAEKGLRFSVITPLGQLDPAQLRRMHGALCHAFLLRELEHCLATLSDLVMRPLAAWLREQGATGVTIIPTGWLAAFPLLACPLAGGQTFADAFPQGASVAPSFRSLLHADRTQRRRSGVATLGNPFPTTQPLKFGQAEALTLAHLGGDPRRCHIQGEATRAWLLECLRDALVVDASCHGVAEQDYLQSRLLLADGDLTLADALNQRIADPYGLRLLILSACQTAIPDLRGARSEVRSLAVGMLQAGIHAVMASLWSVDDRATYLLMVQFARIWFPHMHEMSPAAALSLAQRWLRTVTWRQLQDWQAQEPIPLVWRDMPDHRPADQRAPTPAGATKTATVRGGEDYPLFDDAWMYEDDDPHRDDPTRYTMPEAEERIRDWAEEKAQRDPDARPFAHPFFWAGFQVTGW